MKLILTFARIFVGVLFIFSGFIKLNDPLGFSYKLQEYFSPEVLNIPFLIPFALGLSILLVITEVILGVTLLLGYAKKITVWLLLLMIGFFTFLTFYSAYFNKVTDCGCFGDAIPLVPWESFIKDVILSILILILFFNWKKIKPIFSKGVRSITVLMTLVACLAFGYHVLMHLPWLDFRAYKVGANIAKGMEVPEGAPEAVFEYNWKFNVDGEEKIFTTSGEYPQVNGKYIEVKTKMISPGYEPPVHDFTIERDGNDFTTQFLEKENLIAIVAYNLDKTEREGYYNIRKAAQEAIKKGYTVIGMTSSSPTVHKKFVKDYELPFKFYFTDETVLKTIVRASPGIVSMNKGTIIQKLHWNDANDIILKENLATAKPNLNFKIKFQLDSISRLDQQYRKLLQLENQPKKLKALAQELGLSQEEYTGNLWEKQELIDLSSMSMVERIISKYGYPGKTLVGTPTNTAAWSVIQHNPDKIPTYLPMLREAATKDELPFRLVAMMEDRYLMGKELPQKYGTQGATYGSTSYIWPIENPEKVNQRRKEAGFSQTVEAYSKLLFGDAFEYRELTIKQAQKIKEKALRNITPN